MSSYTDIYGYMGHQNDLDLSPEEKLNKKCFSKLNPKPLESLVNRNEKTILFMCLLLIFIYGITLFSTYTIMNEVYAKDEYFFKHLSVEKQRIKEYQDDLKRLSTHVMPKYDPNDVECVQCRHAWWKIDLRHIGRVIENNQHIKQEYYDVLLPCQHSLVFLCLFNTISIVAVFNEPFKLFFLSNFLSIMCLWICGEILVEDQRILRAMLILGLCIFLFSLFLLFLMIKTLILVLHYQKMKNTLITN